jgi:uncharacterized membrane protein YoaK (UPF0700 family)
VDVIGFLALGGLFTAHITGNLVVAAAHYGTGRFSKFPPLLAIPVFIGVVIIVTCWANAPQTRGYRIQRTLLILQAVLLALCLVLWSGLGPFTNADHLAPVFVGMMAVAAMATQSVLVKMTIPTAPPTTAMTGNFTQLVVDFTKILRSDSSTDAAIKAKHRAAVTCSCLIGWAIGCGGGAVLEMRHNLGALALPTALAGLAILVGELRAGTDDNHSASSSSAHSGPQSVSLEVGCADHGGAQRLA